MGWRHASCCPRRSPSLLPVLTRGAPSYPPGLAALRRAPAVLRGLRLARSPLRYRLASPRTLRTPVTVCPPAPRLRSSRLPLADSLCRRSPLAPPAGWSAVLCAASPSPRLPPGSPSAVWHRCLCLRLSVPSLPPLLMPDGLPPLPPTLCALAPSLLPAGWAAASVSDSLCRRPIPSCRMGCRPRSRGACGQMLSPVRSGAPPTCHASAGRGSVPRRPGERSAPPFGRAAEHARSAARASPGHPPPHSVRALYPRPLSPPAWGGRRPPTSVNPAMTPAGRLGGVV